MKLMMNQRKTAILICIIIYCSSVFTPSFIIGYTFVPPKFEVPLNDLLHFNSTKAYDFIQKQVDIGPRYPGSEGIEKTRHLIASELLPTKKWQINYQNFSKKWIDDQNITLTNIICKPNYNNSIEPSFLLLAHYDTRLWADKDPDPEKRKDPVLGANDGASGVAVVLELGKILVDIHNISNFQLVFFDGEDQGNIGGWNWLVGSRYYVNSQEFESQNLAFVILFDMVGGKDATFKREKNSDKYSSELVNQIWDEANGLGFSKYFVNQPGRTIIDDHVPFIEKDIHAVDIIDNFWSRFKPWHTSFDNMTFIDTKTIEAVGFTLESLLTRITNSKKWPPEFSSFNFRSSILIFDILCGLILIAIIHNNRKRRSFSMV